MLTPWNIYCEGARLRGVLKHAWLENEVESVTPESAVHRCARNGGWPKLEQEFPRRLDSLRGLARSLPDLFSPSELVDRCTAFAALEEPTKSRLREAVHGAYLETSGIAAHQAPLLEAITQLEAALRSFRDCCGKPASVDQSKGRPAWVQVLRAATALRMRLDRLPKGVVFP